MSLLIVLAALVFLMLVAYRGYSVILFAPVAALGAVLLTDPSLVPPMFSSVFMEKMVGFVKNYFPVFMLGAVFGKVIELSGFSKSIVSAVIGAARPRARGAVDRRGLRDPDLWRRVAVRRGVRGLSVRRRDVPPERHSQAAHPLHDRARRIQLHDGCAAGHAADPEHHPDDVLQDHDLGGALARPDRRVFVLVVGLAYIENRRRAAQARGEGYGTELRNEPEPFEAEKLPNPWIALSPLVVVGVANFVLTQLIPRAYGRDARDHARRQADRHPDRRAWRRSGRSKARCCSAS